MNASFRSYVALLSVALCILLVGQQGCDSRVDSFPAEGEECSWHSARMHVIEDEYRLLWRSDLAEQRAHPDAGKEINAGTIRACKRLFDARLSYQDLRQLAASSELLPPRFRDRQGTFSAVMLEFMIQSFVAMGDRDTLVDLLSTRFVSYIGSTQGIEYYLTKQEDLPQDVRGNRLKDPILILGEAYAQCKNPGVREEIAAAVRRAFGGLGIHGQSDAEFVADAMQWYEKEKDHLAVNRCYWLNEIQAIDDTPGEAYDEAHSKIPLGRQPLFERTTSDKSAKKVVAILIIWLLHAGIAVMLSAPIVFLARKRTRWLLWELLAVIVPFSVWLLLTVSELSIGRKGLGNLNEALYLAIGVPMAAIVRVGIGSRLPQRACAGALIALLCVAAVALFFLVPPLPILE